MRKIVSLKDYMPTRHILIAVALTTELITQK